LRRRVFCPGGKWPGAGRRGAQAGRQYAISKGVPADAILVEDHGRTTLESLRTVAAMLRDRGAHTAVFVSDRTHMLRVLRIAHDEGIEAFGSPTRTSPIDASAGERLRATGHEGGALAVYFLRGNEQEQAEEQPTAGRRSAWRTAGARRTRIATENRPGD